MSEQTAISWCDSTFNPWFGCTKVSPACDHCYAERLMDHRRHAVQWGAGQPRKRTRAANWRQPLKWNAKPFYECPECNYRGEGIDGAAGCPFCAAYLRSTRRRVFCASLADVFDNEVPEQWRADLFSLIAQTPHLDWLLLTKRIGNAAAMLDRIAYLGTTESVLARMPLLNIWLGATVVNQEEADRDVPKLLAVPVARRFLSIEPMLGPVDVSRWLGAQCDRGSVPGPHGRGGVTCPLCDGYGAKAPATGCRGIDWIIAGGESGPQARPMHPDWVRSLRDQCAAAGVPFHFKQWGEWLPAETDRPGDGGWYAVADDGSDRELTGRLKLTTVDRQELLHVGTKAAGRLLDGIEHNGVPA